MSGVPLWEQRFRAPATSLPRWARLAPDRAVVAANGDGVWQVYAVDLASGRRREVSEHPLGTREGVPTLDGSGVLFWEDETGDEAGRWLVQPFAGGPAGPFLPDVPAGWSEGLAQAAGVTAVAVGHDDGFIVYVSEEGGQARAIAASERWLGLGAEGAGAAAGLSADGRLLALQHAEHGDVSRPALRVLDSRSGAVAGERGDGSGAVRAAAWSPIAGDLRLAVGHEPADRLAVALWDLADGTWAELGTDLPGDVEALDWWPDGRALLLRHTLSGRSELWRAEPATGGLTRVPTPAGTVDEARVRPDGAVWLLHTDGERAPRVLVDRVGEPLPFHAPAPPGRPFREWRFPNDRGETVEGWIVEPEGPGPHPVLVYVHGGPNWLYEDRYLPDVQALVDAGFLVGLPNYRGSTGYGRAWRESLLGDPGGKDVDDVTAGLRDLLRRPDTDASRTVVAGWSWGGFITLMQLGRNPDLWTAGMAGVPVGDFVLCYRDAAPALKEWDRAIFGGSPDELPEAYRRASPITYADAVRAPVLLVIGEQDSRCPLAQALAYVDRLAARGAEHEVYRFAGGHGSYDTDEVVRQQRLILDFLARTAGTAPPDGGS